MNAGGLCFPPIAVPVVVKIIVGIAAAARDSKRTGPS